MTKNLMRVLEGLGEYNIRPLRDYYSLRVGEQRQFLISENDLFKLKYKLKALEIIKNKRVDVRYIIEEKPTREEYNAYIWLRGYCFDTLDDEEFDAVNEVLINV